MPALLRDAGMAHLNHRLVRRPAKTSALQFCLHHTSRPIAAVSGNSLPGRRIFAFRACCWLYLTLCDLLTFVDMTNTLGFSSSLVARFSWLLVPRGQPILRILDHRPGNRRRRCLAHRMRNRGTSRTPLGRKSQPKRLLVNRPKSPTRQARRQPANRKPLQNGESESTS